VQAMDASQGTQLRESVRLAYSAIAERPDEDPLFPTGRALALGLGYSPELLDTLPAVAVETFCGVSNVSVFADIPEGAHVLDLGCGAGLDLLIAARRVGRALPDGLPDVTSGKSGKRVIGVDFSRAMLERARRAVAEAGAENVNLLEAAAEDLPLESGSVDVALANGIFNLNPARESIFRELARVVRPEGAVFAAELILREPISVEESIDPANWFS